MNIFYKGEDITLIFSSENDISDYTKVVKVFTPLSSVKTATIYEIDDNSFSATITNTQTADLKTGNFNIVLELTQGGAKAISKIVKAKLNDAYIDGGEREDSSSYTYQINFTEGNHIDINFGANFIISQVFSWFTFIWKLFTGFTIAELRLLTNSQLTLVSTFSCKDEGRIKDWFYDSSDTTSLDNNGTILVTTSGKRLKARKDSSDYTVENFGAKGDGSDDTTYIQNAINWVASLQKGGILKFASKQYSVTHLLFKKGCSIVSNGGYYIGSKTDSNGASIIAINENFQDSFIDFELDHTFTGQNGEIDGLQKSAPEFNINGIILNGGKLNKHTLSITQSWGFSIEKCKIVGGWMQSLKIVDCNEFVLDKNQIDGYLSISNADYIESDNDIKGDDKFPAYHSDRTGLGVRNSNKIYLGGSINHKYRYNVTSIVNGVFTISNKTILPINPNFEIYQTTGSVSFDSSLQKLLITSINGDNTVVVANTGELGLAKGCQYTISGQVKTTGVSSSRNIQLSCGNLTQVYGNITATNTTTTFSIDFTFSPQLNIYTSPVKITINNSVISGNDIIEFNNLVIYQKDYKEINGLPFTFDYDDTISDNLKNDYPHSECFYPKFLSSNTLILYRSLADFTNNYNPFSGTYSGLTNCQIGIPNCTFHLNGAVVGHSSTNTGNKIEDIINDGVVLRGTYNHVFSGTKLSKAIDSENARLFCITKGSTKNQITGNSISSRVNASIDTTSICIYIDKYSGNNTISNKIGDASYIDIFDEFEGNESEKNKYTYSDNNFIYQKKPLDYNSTEKGIILNKNRNSFLVFNSILINSSEFSLLFKGVEFTNSTGDSYLFQQKDISLPTQTGRFLIVIASTGSIYVSVENTIVAQIYGVLLSGKSYDIIVQKSLDNRWEIYIDGINVYSSIVSASNIATTVGTKTYIGSGDGIQLADLTIKGFQYFTENLLDFEVKNLFSNKFNNKSKNIYLLNSNIDGINTLSTPTNVSYSVESGTGINGLDSLKLVTANSNTIKLNVTGSIIKNTTVRVSCWVKSDVATKLGLGRKTNYKYKNISTSYTKVVFYVNTNNTSSSGDYLILTIGQYLKTLFGVNYSAISSTTYISNLLLSSTYYPSTVFVDFTKNRNYLNQFYNDLDSSDTFYYYDGIGGFFWKTDPTNRTFALIRNNTTSSTTGTKVFEVDVNGNITVDSSVRLYANIFSKSGSALQLGTEGSNSLQFIINNAVNAQLFGSGNMFIGTSPSDSGDKLQVSGTSLFTNKIKFSTGSNKPVGSGTLVAGTVTVSNTLVTSSSIIILSRTTSGGTPGTLSYTKNAGVGFTVTSTSNTDTSTFDYLIIN